MGTVAAHGMRKSFGDVQALDGVTLDVPDGSFFVVLGPSGAGKTTTLRSIAGLEKLDEGSVHLDGRDATTDTPAARDLAMVFQSYALYPRLTAYDNIASPLKLRGARDTREKVHAMAARLHIDHLLDRYPSELSGGQQQRVALARALAKEAPLILLDEPLVNLDYKLREELRDELSELFAEGRSTVVYATTEPGEALLLGGHTAVLDAGELLQYGPTAEVFHRPNSIRVARAFSDPPMNLFAARRHNGGFVLQGDVAVERALPPGADADITAGLRAGALDVTPRPGYVALPGRVTLAEISGSDTFVHAATAAGDVVAQLPGVHRYSLDERVALYFDPAQTYAFGADGALLTAPRQPASVGEAA